MMSLILAVNQCRKTLTFEPARANPHQNSFCPKTLTEPIHQHHRVRFQPGGRRIHSSGVIHAVVVVNDRLVLSRELRDVWDDPLLAVLLCGYLRPSRVQERLGHL